MEIAKGATAIFSVRLLVPNFNGGDHSEIKYETEDGQEVLFYANVLYWVDEVSSVDIVGDASSCTTAGNHCSVTRTTKERGDTTLFRLDPFPNS